MAIGKVEAYIHEILSTKGAMLFSVIDPLDHKSVEDAVKTAESVVKGGADLVLVGGSIGAQGEILDTVSKGIKEKVDVPLVLFPGNISTLTKYADAVYFMSLLNARNPYWITQAQMLAAPVVKHMKIEPLPVGYIVIYPGGTVGWVGDVNFVPREKPKIAANLALAGEYLGNRLIIVDTGSNPRMQHSGPAPKEMLAAVKSEITVPLVAAGGIVTANDARNAFQGGADIIQIGTAFEGNAAAYKKAQLFSKIAKEEGAKKLKQF
ncbi:MAG: geranylgeranylglyceryl/heptaprenylglyceryl phosphate synthase [Candidatus Micrarchaeia archaeon]